MLQFFIVCGLFFNKGALTQDCKADDKYAWSYHGPDNGPEHWAEHYPDCGKKFQSPIAIWHKDVENLHLTRLQYNGFNNPITNATVLDQGWTVFVIPQDGVSRFIKWGYEKYILDGIHFHFGNKSEPGAEHILDGIRYEMEIHYATHQERNPDNVAVVASLMKVTDIHNSGFEPITEVLPDVLYNGNSAKLRSQLDLAGLLPQDSGSYYYYKGSNAIPPCQSGYEWWILKEIGRVGEDQLDEFMDLYSVGEDDASGSCLMGLNYRPVQDLDGRPIVASE